MKKKIIDSALISLLVTGITAGIALLFNDTRSEWYISLVKPDIQPPSWVFGVVWTVVYLLFAFSLTLAMVNDANGKVYFLYALQGVLNILWCLCFFTLHLPLVGFGIILAYLTVTYLTARFVHPYSRAAAWLLLPQTLWLILATAINYMVVLLN